MRKTLPDEVSFKYLRWALVKNPDNLSEQETKILKEAFHISDDLKEVYQLRKDLKKIFDTDLTKQEPFLQLQTWRKRAQKIDTKPVESFLKILNNWKDKVLSRTGNPVLSSKTYKCCR